MSTSADTDRAGLYITGSALSLLSHMEASKPNLVRWAHNLSSRQNQGTSPRSVLHSQVIEVCQLDIVRQTHKQAGYMLMLMALLIVMGE